MGSWSTSITGNDTAQDLYSEYTAAFYKFDTEEALKRIDQYVRSEMFDESDEEEWCNYNYSLADFMWKKGILTPSVRDQAVEMIDSGFGLELWAEEGEKTLNTRKKKLAEFREKILSPLPPKKKIRPNTFLERIFEDGDIVAIQLQTAGKPYKAAYKRPMSEEAFHALDGKYVLMQLVRCFASWTSRIVPEVKDHWAIFRLFDGVYDSIPTDIDVAALKDAMIFGGRGVSSCFDCESSMFYFKKRNYKVVCNRKDLLEGYNCGKFDMISLRNHPDSDFAAAMGLGIECCEYTGTSEEMENICRKANRYGRYRHTHTIEELKTYFTVGENLVADIISTATTEGRELYTGRYVVLSDKELDALFTAEEDIIADKISSALANGGKLYSISFGKTIGIVTVDGGHIDNLYIEGQYQRNGFGARLLKFAFSVAGDGAYIDVSTSHESLLHICKEIGLVKAEENEHTIRMTKA